MSQINLYVYFTTIFNELQSPFFKRAFAGAHNPQIRAKLNLYPWGALQRVCRVVQLPPCFKKNNRDSICRRRHNSHTQGDGMGSGAYSKKNCCLLRPEGNPTPRGLPGPSLCPPDTPILSPGVWLGQLLL